MKTIFKNICLLLFVSLLIAVAACKKTTTTVNCKLTKVQTGTDTSLITYDAQGRVATYGSLLNGVYSFTYSGLTAANTIQYYDTSDHQTANISLDANGRMIFMSRTNYSGGFIQNYTYSFEYDAAGQVVMCEQSHRIAGSTDVTYYKDSLVYADGNLTDKYTFQKFNSGAYLPYEHIKVEYGSELNKIGGSVFYGYEPPMSATGYYFPYSHLLGNTSKNLPAYTKYYDNTETLFVQVAFSFLLNENGYPTEVNMVRTIHYIGAINRKFEYSCD